MSHSIDQHNDPEDLWRRAVGNPVVDAAEQALRAFGGDISHADACLLLPMWTHYPRLSPRERDAVLARFEDPEQAS